MQRAASGTFQDSNDGEISSDAGWGASHLGRCSSQGKPLSSSIHARIGCFCTDRAALRGEATLYRGRQRSSFTVQAQRCGRAGEVLEGKASNSEDTIDNQKGKQVLSRARQVTRSKKREARSEEQGWSSETKLDGPATCNTGAEFDAAYEMPDNVSRLGAAVEGSYPPKDRRLVSIKLPGDPPFARSSFPPRPAHISFLYLSFAIYSSCG
jgi:hypothetical protein